MAKKRPSRKQTEVFRTSDQERAELERIGMGLGPLLSPGDPGNFGAYAEVGDDEDAPLTQQGFEEYFSDFMRSVIPETRLDTGPPQAPDLFEQFRTEGGQKTELHLPPPSDNRTTELYLPPPTEYLSEDEPIQGPPVPPLFVSERWGPIDPALKIYRGEDEVPLSAKGADAERYRRGEISEEEWGNLQAENQGKRERWERSAFVAGPEKIAELSADLGGEFTVPQAPEGMGPGETLSLACPHCSRTLGVPAAYAGQIMRCPYCSGKVIAADPETTVEAEGFAPPEPDEGAEMLAPESPEVESSEVPAEPEPMTELPPPLDYSTMSPLDAQRAAIGQMSPEDREQTLAQTQDQIRQMEEAFARGNYGPAGAKRRSAARGRLGMRALRSVGLDSPFRGALSLFRDVRGAFGADTAEERAAAGLPNASDMSGEGMPTLEELRAIRTLLEEAMREHAGDGSSTAERNLAEGSPADSVLGNPTAPKDEKEPGENPAGGGWMDDLRMVLGGGGGGPRRPGTPVAPPGGAPPVPPVPGGGGGGGGGSRWSRVGRTAAEGVRVLWRLFTR